MQHKATRISTKINQIQIIAEFLWVWVRVYVSVSVTGFKFEFGSVDVGIWTGFWLSFINFWLADRQISSWANAQTACWACRERLVLKSCRLWDTEEQRYRNWIRAKDRDGDLCQRSHRDWAHLLGADAQRRDDCVKMKKKNKNKIKRSYKLAHNFRCLRCVGRLC